jgi:thiol-disulfide isomerase/thioredoxin
MYCNIKMSSLTKPIAYLEDSDFDENGNITNNDIPSNIPVVVMLQSSWCPHCTTAKPAFQKFANASEGAVFCATIQSDGEKDSEKKLGKRISSIKSNFRGFPDYVLFMNKKIVDKEIGGRSVDDLKKFSGM